MNRFDLAGRVALVTGSSRGLGKAMAMELARAGAKVAINYANSRETAERTLAEVAATGAACCLVHADVTDEGDVAHLCDEVASTLGPIDILVPNATCNQPELPLEEYDWAFFQRMLDFFVKSPVLLTKACLPHMKRQRWGRIVQITSEVFTIGVAPFSAYVAAKGGQVGLSRSLARELAPYGITVNMVAPGWIPVERHAVYSQDAKDHYLTGVPAGRWGTPDEVAHAVVYLASNEAAFVTGQSIHVNGGRTVW
ncbi:MAG: 3-oxoacyl-ACP reductase family protein [Pirellulales bacterium]